MPSGLDALDAFQAKSTGTGLDSLEGDVHPQPDAERKGFFGNALDKAGALASGFNREYLARAGLPFNPVDAVANVLDLGRAAIGAPYSAITGKAPPEALQLPDRASIVGSGPWLVNQALKVPVLRQAITAPNPADEGGLPQMLGSGAGGGAGGVSRAQVAVNTGMGAASAGAAKLVQDSGVGGDANPYWAMLASFSPQAAMTGGTNALQRYVRGDEAGRQNMAQRRQDLAEAGIDTPSLGLASGNRGLMGIENLLGSVPGASSIMDDARKRLLAGITGKVGETADLASPNRGVFTAGNAIQSGINQFKDDFKTGQTNLWDNRLGAVIPANWPTGVGQTRAALSNLNADIPGATAVGQFFKNAKIGDLQKAVESDITANGGGGLMNAAPGTTLPFEAVKKTRTLVGNQIADATPLSDVPRSKWNPLYGALTGDIQDAAAAVGPQATNAFNRANNYTRAGMDRLDAVAPFANANSPERAYLSLMQNAKENTSVLQAVKKSLPDDARGSVAGTVIERLGLATPGKQDETGTAWSPETFLTNWNGLSAKSRGELFSGFPNSEQVRSQVDAIAKATAMLRDSSKIWSNPSGTADRLGAKGIYASVIGPLAAGVATGHPVAGALTAGGTLIGMGGANIAARKLTNGSMLDWFSNPSTAANLLDPRNPAVAQQLVNIPGLLSQ